jgi:hypothetical protein
MNVRTPRGHFQALRHAWLVVVAAVLVVGGSLSFLPFQSLRQAAAAPPVLQAAPVSPPGFPGSGQPGLAVLQGGPSLAVTVVAPGIAAYNGPIVNRNNGYAFQAGVTLTAPTQGNPDFVTNVQQLLGVINNGVSASGAVLTTGQRLSNFFQFAHPLPNPQGGWGTLTGRGANIFAQTNAGGTPVPSGINVVIGICDGSFGGPEYRALSLNSEADSNGEGTVSVICLPPALPAVSLPNGPGALNMRIIPPNIALVHELVHAAHDLAGGYSEGDSTYTVGLADGTQATLTDPTEEVLTVGGPILAAQVNGAVFFRGQLPRLAPNHAMAQAALTALGISGSYQLSSANSGYGQNPQSIAELRASVVQVSENSYNADVDLIQRPYFGNLDSNSGMGQSYQMTNFTSAISGFTQADQLNPTASTRLVQPSAQVPPGTVPTFTVPNCTYPSSSSSYDCVETGTPGTPTAAATAAFNAVRAVLAAGNQPSCVGLGGYVSAASAGGSATIALASAVADWNATGAPVKWTNSTPSSGTPAQAPDVTVSYSSSQTANFTVSMPCDGPDTITLGNGFGSGFTSLLSSAQELVMNQALGTLMGLGDDPAGSHTSIMDQFNFDDVELDDPSAAVKPQTWDVAQVWAVIDPQDPSLNGFAPNSYIGEGSSTGPTGYALGFGSTVPLPSAPATWAAQASDGSTGGPNGMGGWSYVPLNDWWGQIVNSATGYCLRALGARGSLGEFTADECVPQSADGFEAGNSLSSVAAGTVWFVTSQTRGFTLRSASASSCLGSVTRSVNPVFQDCGTVPALTVSTAIPVATSSSLFPTDPKKRSIQVPGFPIVSQASGTSRMCLNVVGSPASAPSTATNVEIRGCVSGQASQLWNYIPGSQLITAFSPPRGTLVTSVASLSCLTAAGTTNGSAVQVGPCSAGSSSQQWFMAGNGNIVNVSSGLCVVTQKAATSAGTLGILYACTNNNSAPGDNEQWSYATSFNAPSSLYTNFGSFNSLTSSGSNLVTGASSNTPGSLAGGDVWGWVSDLAVSSSGYGLLEDITQNQCLSASGSSVTLTTCVLSSGTATAQDWQQIGSGDGTALFQQAGTTNCLDVLNNINASGAPVGLYSCSTSYSNQQWTVVPLQSVPAPLSTDAFASGSSGGDWSVSGPNWAETGIASQSSTWSNGATSNASYAIDGNVVSNDQHSNISATSGQSSDPYPWWQDDMGDRYPISAVNVYNRTDCCATNLSKFWVFTSNAPFNTALTPTQQATQPGVSATYVAGPAGTPTMVAMPFGGVIARYIMIQLSGTGTLNGRSHHHHTAGNLAWLRSIPQWRRHLYLDRRVGVPHVTRSHFLTGTGEHT